VQRTNTASGPNVREGCPKSDNSNLEGRRREPGAQAAWTPLKKGGQPVQRRARDWIEALSAYLRGYNKVAVDARLIGLQCCYVTMA
jgi:hypothetical protein